MKLIAWETIQGVTKFAVGYLAFSPLPLKAVMVHIAVNMRP